MKRKRETCVLGDSLLQFSEDEIKEATQNFSSGLQLGSGTFGVVYFGFLRGTKCAIKMIQRSADDEGLQEKEFEREVGMLMKLRHPNIVDLIGICSDLKALVLEYVELGSLEDLMSSEEGLELLTWRDMMKIALEIGRTIRFLHLCRPHPLVFGDLKPDNILLNPKLEIKLGDFGCCRELKNDKRVQLNDMVGTEGYIHREMLTKILSRRADLAGFGYILLRLFSGQNEPIEAEIRSRNAFVTKKNLVQFLDKRAGKWPTSLVKPLIRLAGNCVWAEKEKDKPLLEVIQHLEKLLNPEVMLADTLSGFLGSLGLADHLPTFIEKEIDLNKLKKMKATELEDLDIPKKARMKIMVTLLQHQDIFR